MYSVCESPSRDHSFTNKAYYCPKDINMTSCYLMCESKNPHIFCSEASELVQSKCIALNKYQRISSKCRKYSAKKKKYKFKIVDGNKIQYIDELDILISKRKNGDSIKIDGEDLIEDILGSEQVFKIGQKFAIDYPDSLLICTVIDMKLHDLSDISSTHTDTFTDYGKIMNRSEDLTRLCLCETKIILKIDSDHKKKIKLTNIPISAGGGLFKEKTSFQDLGIGGLDDQLKVMFRRAFASRIYPKKVIKQYGINHIKGIILYGSPGCGKTLIARTFGKILNTHEPKIISGPEIMNKFVGKSEENIRNLFIDAEKEYSENGENSKLHLVIIDEIDAICKSRGSVRSGTGVHDSVVNQLLSKIDGVNEIDNILIIGMTNRIDMIDDALLRPGRFDIKIEIKLPNEEGRRQIFNIHTKVLKKNKLLGNDVDTTKLAKMTNNYSGAEIAGVIRSAVAYTLNKNIDFNNLDKSMEELSKLSKGEVILMKNFVKAIKEVKPAFGIADNDFRSLLIRPLISYGDRFTYIQSIIQKFMNKLLTSTRHNLFSLLLEGQPGCGNTSLAIHMACNSKYPFIKMISASNMIGFSEISKCNYITNIFDEAYKSPQSIIILDDIERIIGYINSGPRFSNMVLQALLVLIKKLPGSKQKLMIIGTTSIKDKLKELNVTDIFNEILNIPNLTTDKPDELYQIFQNIGIKKDYDKLVKSLPKSISVKELLLKLDMQ